MFHSSIILGEAVINITLNATSLAHGRLLLYHREDWHDAVDDDDCIRRIGKARMVYLLKTKQSENKVPHSSYPRIWHLIYVDEHTCQDEDAGGISAILPPPRDYLQYEILLLNPDALGNPLEHFGDEETGLLRFYQLLTVAYFVVACAFAPRLHQTLSKGGPMQLVIQLLTVSVCLQAVGAFFNVVDLSRYSKDGIGLPALEVTSES
ncbi:hypothetical protein C0Q70_21559 [Pomacea canaliculata]|uniref:Uncharacterized protein n=1 Tax=Pomacea canaliculata TaxID=400727 RepID=A0A2T7NCU6_POMCA|nr:hypothetical protein C0Q70_21559 [Pomacea canaliculata]